MVENMESKKCDVDDLMCQMRLMGHLEGMKNIMGTDKFQQLYPEYAGLAEATSIKLEEQKTTLRSSLESCGLPIPEELQVAIQETAENEQVIQE